MSKCPICGEYLDADEGIEYCEDCRDCAELEDILDHWFEAEGLSKPKNRSK